MPPFFYLFLAICGHYDVESEGQSRHIKGVYT